MHGISEATKLIRKLYIRFRYPEWYHTATACDEIWGIVERRQSEKEEGDINE